MSHPSDKPRDAQLLADGLDKYVTVDPAGTRQVFDAEKDLITSFTRPFTPDFQGSWNKPVLAWCTWLIATADREPARLLVDYVKGQLGEDGLWGREILSWLYWWPLPAVGLVYDWLRDSESNASQLDAALRSNLERKLARLLKAHVLTLSLFALPEENPDAPGCPAVWCPGIRTWPDDKGNLGLSYFFATALEPGLRIPDGGKTKQHWGWPYRVTEKLSHDYLDQNDRRLARENRDHGTQAAAIVDVLKALGVRFQATVKLWRYKNGDTCATITRNTHGTKPPVVGVSCVAGDFHFLRGLEKKKKGAKRDRDHNQIVYEEKDDDHILAPRPSEALLYEVTIGPQGVRMDS